MMELIKTNNHLEIKITHEYNPALGSYKYNFKSEDMIPIIVLNYKTIKNSEIIDSYEFVYDYTSEIISKDCEVYTFNIDITKDGWFTVYSLILPTKEWFENPNSFKVYKNIFYIDGQTIYKNIKGEESKIKDIANLLLPNFTDSTLYREEQDVVSIWNLRNCYINLCKLIFNDRAFSSCWNKNSIDSELIYKRDLAWMAINIIKYLTKCSQFAEVLRIILNIQGCNGLCPNNNIVNNGCGCSH